MSEPLRASLEQAVFEALSALDPARLVYDALPPLPPKRARVRVIAAGKAALAMARGALARWPDRIEDALVVTIDPLSREARADPRMTVLGAAHPLPDERSVAAAMRALRRAAELDANDLLLTLISGGASSLLAAPPEGVRLEEKRALVATLLESGATIREVNLVRRHFSRVKGGRLALAAAPARVLTLLLSDVIGGEPHDIGSGPTVPDPTTLDDARAVLHRYMPDAAQAAWLEESLKPGAARARAQVLASPASLAQAIATNLSTTALHVTVDAEDEGDANDIVERRLARADALRAGEAVVIACEPTLRLPPDRGRGGRAGWIALSAMRRLPDGVTFLAVASDGVDGSSGARGAVVERADALRLEDASIDAALARFDDARAHEALGTQLSGGATGNNLADVHVLARA